MVAKIQEQKQEAETAKSVTISELLKSRITNMDKLRELSWNGIPPKYRAEVWKLLLGYLPANSSRRAATLKRRRQEYSDISSICLKAVETGPVTPSETERETFRQIKVDVPRTAPCVLLFRNERVQKSLLNLLYSWAYRNPATSYVQGINDIIAPLFAVFLGGYFDGADVTRWNLDRKEISEEIFLEVEADCFFCLTNFLSNIQENFTADQPGIQRMVHKLETFIERIDNDLHQHFKKCGLQFLYFSFRWMNCLLTREFSIHSIIRMWDTYFSETHAKGGFDQFHVYVCAALLLNYRPFLKGMSHDELFEFLTTKLRNMSDSSINIEMILSQAHVWKVSFNESQSHFSSLDSKIKTKHTIISTSPIISLRQEIKVDDDVDDDDEDSSDEELAPTCFMNDVDFLCYKTDE